MLKITIDCNSDYISFVNNGKLDGEMKCDSPNQLCQILVELLNKIPDLKDILLEKVDEDNRMLVDEW